VNRISSSRPGIRRGAAGWGLAASLLLALPLAAQEQAAGSSLPLSNTWNIASSGKASSSGELLFRVTPGDGEDPVEVTVFVLSGANETGIASSIRRALSTQLNAQKFDIQAGQGANVLVTGPPGAPGQAAPGFSVELIDSDVENIRVMVQSAAPVAPPTVPVQGVPANPPNPAAPQDSASPGDAAPAANPQAPSDSQTPATPAPNAPTSPAPETPPPNSPASPSPATPAPSAPASPPPAPGGTSSSANGGAGAPASAPPPPPAAPGGL
jgi:hypothetical protein